MATVAMVTVMVAAFMVAMVKAAVMATALVVVLLMMHNDGDADAGASCVTTVIAVVLLLANATVAVISNITTIAINAIFIVIFAPVFSAIWVNLARRNLDPSTPIKFALGLIGMAIGFLMMFRAARVVADGLPAAAYWLVLTYLFHTFGELCLSPVGLWPGVFIGYSAHCGGE